jgi:formylglycine-generating enzyme required for sulfatase activity
MVLIPGGDYNFKVTGIEIEKSEGVDVQYPWEDKPVLEHERRMTLQPFYIDKTPVTCAQFKRFIDATHYRPKDDHNFLRNWVNGRFPESWANKPVTWVSIEDARAYAKWAGKRLPHEWEWQYAAQGTDGRLYPWGNEKDDSRVPPLERGRVEGAPADVEAYPQGASPFGVLDLVGNVWQWTDEFRDEHTRAAILKGGSHYRPSRSMWYLPQARQLDQHGKYLLMAPSLDRSATIGFRCVVDAKASAARQ